jgi:hypothetical protein
MKTLLLVLAVLGWLVLNAPAQVTIEVTQDQDQFLLGEALPVAVKITNLSGQKVHLGEEPNWLTFNIESMDGFEVFKSAEVPVVGAFDLESSQMGIKRVDLAPYFSLTRSGRYKIVATLRIKDWSMEAPSAPKFFDVINGVTMWSQDFGVPMEGIPAGQPPEMRRYSLIKANYERTQLRLYAQVSNPADAQMFKVKEIGSLLSFSNPEAQVDRYGMLHVLFQSGASLFSYTVIQPDGTFIKQEFFDYVSTRPRLGVDDSGDIVVTGGVRRMHSDELPAVKMPSEVPRPAPAPAAVANH